ncbi:MAG: hypothetical protein QXQ82_00750 [Candidatus Pacearchaeota archaeon]
MSLKKILVIATLAPGGLGARIYLINFFDKYKIGIKVRQKTELTEEKCQKIEEFVNDLLEDAKKFLTGDSQLCENSLFEEFFPRYIDARERLSLKDLDSVYRQIDSTQKVWKNIFSQLKIKPRGENYFTIYSPVDSPKIEVKESRISKIITGEYNWRGHHIHWKLFKIEF